MSAQAARLLEHQPRIFWGRVVQVFIKRGWQPPKPDQRIAEDLYRAFAERAPGLPPEPAESPLTERQREILQLVAHGLESEEIAAVVGTGTATVKWHLTEVYRRLEATNRAHAVAIGLRLQLIT